MSSCGAQTVTIAAKPRFQTRGGLIDLVVDDGGQSFNILWGAAPSTYFVPVSLDTNRIYTFTVIHTPHNRIKVPEIRRIQLDGQTIYDMEVCDVHKIRMQHRKVEIIYGLVRPEPSAPSSETERRLFPHRREFSLGGCIPGAEKTETIYICPECKKAYQRWNSERKKA